MCELFQTQWHIAGCSIAILNQIQFISAECKTNMGWQIISCRTHPQSHKQSWEEITSLLNDGSIRLSFLLCDCHRPKWTDCATASTSADCFVLIFRFSLGGGGFLEFCCSVVTPLLIFSKSLDIYWQRISLSTKGWGLAQLCAEADLQM